MLTQQQYKNLIDVLDTNIETLYDTVVNGKDTANLGRVLISNHQMLKSLKNSKKRGNPKILPRNQF